MFGIFRPIYRDLEDLATSSNLTAWNVFNYSLYYLGLLFIDLRIWLLSIAIYQNRVDPKSFVYFQYDELMHKCAQLLTAKNALVGVFSLMFASLPINFFIGFIHYRVCVTSCTVEHTLVVRPFVTAEQFGSVEHGCQPDNCGDFWFQEIVNFKRSVAKSCHHWTNTTTSYWKCQ